jgi:hypothetical protein
VHEVEDRLEVRAGSGREDTDSSARLMRTSPGCTMASIGPEDTWGSGAAEMAGDADWMACVVIARG